MKLLIPFILYFFCLNLFAMGSKRPSEPTPVPAPTPAPQPVPKPGPIGEKLPDTIYLDISSIVARDVEEIMNQFELSKSREIINPDKIDQCSDQPIHRDFSESISFYALKMLEDTPSKANFVASYYGTPTSELSYYPSSLIRNPLCRVSSESLKSTLGKNIPTPDVIEKINKFSTHINSLREEVLSGKNEKKEELLKSWSTWFSCLSYAESLTSADSAKSRSVASKYEDAAYSKPSGVKFYEDPYQNAESKLNIGLFQFTPNSGGNIQPCIRAWNELNPSCAVRTNESQMNLVKIVGSSLQNFNAFCGIHKLIQTFSIQVNTTKTSATSPQNISNGKFLNSNQRCVTPHIAAGKAYNHFGPYQNSTGKNLATFMSCVDRALFRP